MEVPLKKPNGIKRKSKEDWQISAGLS